MPLLQGVGKRPICTDQLEEYLAMLKITAVVLERNQVQKWSNVNTPMKLSWTQSSVTEAKQADTSVETGVVCVMALPGERPVHHFFSKVT